MARKSLCTGDAATNQHAEIADGKEQGQEPKDEERTADVSTLRRGWTMHEPKTIAEKESAERQRHHEGCLIEAAYAAIPAPCRPPCRDYQISSQNSHAGIHYLVFHEAEVPSSSPQHKHRYDKYISSDTVPVGALTKKGCGKSREQAQRAAGDMKSQHRRELHDEPPALKRYFLSWIFLRTKVRSFHHLNRSTVAAQAYGCCEEGCGYGQAYPQSRLAEKVGGDEFCQWIHRGAARRHGDGRLRPGQATHQHVNEMRSVECDFLDYKNHKGRQERPYKWRARRPG